MSANCILDAVGERYAKNSRAVFSLKYHLVWCPKYRRPVLVKPVDSRLKVLLKQKAEEMELTLHLLEVMPDHVHAFVEGLPTKCIAKDTWGR
jgi:putative transposase